MRRAVETCLMILALVLFHPLPPKVLDSFIFWVCVLPVYGYCVRRLHSAESKSCCHRTPCYWRKTDVTGCRRRSRYLHWFRLLYFGIHKLTCLAFNPVFLWKELLSYGDPKPNFFWQMRFFQGGRNEVISPLLLLHFRITGALVVITVWGVSIHSHILLRGPIKPYI